MEPFRIDVPESQLDDLRARLRATRWPEPATVADWSQGVPLEWLRSLCSYWATGYDWRRVEGWLNGLPQFRTVIDGLGFHLLHVRSPHDDALPLVLTHGWPGSVLEFRKVIGPLTDPVAYGGRASDAFHVVVPSLPGYGFSDKPASVGWGVERIAAAWATLMSRLGYERYGAVGSDWGTTVSTLLGVASADRIAGIHLMPPLAPPDPATFGDLTEAEESALAALREASEWGSGYSRQQATRPQTVGYGLVDSPVGLCAWIAEKYWFWTDHPGSLSTVVSRDELLDTVMLYWLPAAGASAARLYWESIRQVDEWIAGRVGDAVDVPTGCTVFPKELQRPSRRWAERRFTNIVHWSEPARGGHFAALEQPEIVVDEIRTFFRLVR
ncbi:epoxide hydrolase family protein [Jiangella anatolica]|uniref:Epoxide hydrolase n=1 Tax=Jiangella anatolica TaxID=2670374 RepID=A0A2W2C1V1_9ACTN|nr:epoxide hydrolase family protein [Jiangella anatolica]PZF81957.1 epoxide hydrolase [Jiangella anatolica]